MKLPAFGHETVQYVSNIYKYYVAYSLANERRDNAEEARKEFKLRKE